MTDVTYKYIGPLYGPIIGIIFYSENKTLCVFRKYQTDEGTKFALDIHMLNIINTAPFNQFQCAHPKKYCGIMTFEFNEDDFFVTKIIF